jgi:hypothetical protein
MMGVKVTLLTSLRSQSHVVAESISWSFLLISKVPSGLQFEPTTENFNQLRHRSEVGYFNTHEVRLVYLSGTKSPHLPQGSPWKWQIGKQTRLAWLIKGSCAPR